MKLAGRGHRLSQGQYTRSAAGPGLPPEPRPCSLCGVVRQHSKAQLMMRLARFHPFAVLAAVTLAVPLLWRLSDLDYDQAPLGTALAVVSYILVWPVQVVLTTLYTATGAPPSSTMGLLGWSIVIASYLALDYAVTRAVRARQRLSNTNAA